MSGWHLGAIDALCGTDYRRVAAERVGTMESHTHMTSAAQRFWQLRKDTLAMCLLATALPLGAIFLAVQLAMPAFVFEHVTVLLVVGMALIGGQAPAIVVAVVASIGDNVLLRQPIGRPAIAGFRDILDFGLFLAVATTVGWLVNRMQAAKEAATLAAERERRAREQRDQLVATVTHDLVTPLTVILGTIQFVRVRGAESLDLPRILVRLEMAASRATSLVRTLRDARSLEEDSLALETRRVDIRTVVEPTVRMLERLSDRHPIALTMPESPLLLDCDLERIARVLENLVTNAMKYSPDGGPVDVSILEEAGFAVVRVEDRGIGIPVVNRARLFELGYRTPTAADVAPGLGLGLYIAAAIVQKHGGSLEASPRTGGGSVFSVRLPLPRNGQPAAASTGSRGPGSPYQCAS
jgi:signal transduction histidine kinase